jgi:periplasmic protein TonB
MEQSVTILHWPRRLATPLLALAVSLFVFWAMQTLISNSRSVVDDTDDAAFINFIHVEKNDELQTKDRKVQRPPPPPKEPPKPKVEQQKVTPNKANLDGMNLGALDIDMKIDSGLGGINTGDGEYLPIIKVAPIYPRSAAQRGIQGFVVLEFTVTELGTVIDPQVINAEPEGIFNRAAMDAALKFKYKPKIVDGKAVAVTGVRNIIRFELQNSESN